MAGSSLDLLEASQRGQPEAREQFYVAHRWPFLRWSEEVIGLFRKETVNMYQDAILIVYEKIASRKLTVLGRTSERTFSPWAKT